MNKIKKILIAFSFLLLVFSLVSAARIFHRDAQEQRKIEALAQVWEEASDQMQIEARPSPQITATHDEPVMLPEFAALYERNSDIVGWLTIEDTHIHYPVMQNLRDPEYYLNHDFDKNPNISGLPFLDKNSRIHDTDIMLIHGHRMKNGRMFTDLLKYKKESFYKEHPLIQFSTLYEKEAYEIIAVIMSKVYRKTDDVFKYYRIEQVNTPEAFDSYVRSIKRLALYDTGVTARYGDKLLVLSTCEYSTDNGRLAVIARKLT